MRTSVAAASLAAIFAAISLQNFAVAENLVVNGGFETLPPLNDWAVIYGLTTGLGLDAFPHSGLYSAEFYATRGTRDSLEQVLPTNPGVTYEVSFWLANFYNNPQQDNDFTVLWDGARMLRWSMFRFRRTPSTRSRYKLSGFRVRFDLPVGTSQEP